MPISAPSAGQKTTLPTFHYPDAFSYKAQVKKTQLIYARDPIFMCVLYLLFLYMLSVMKYEYICTKFTCM